MDFNNILHSARQNPTAEIPAGWTQGRATFGGLVAAMLYQQIDAQLEAATGGSEETSSAEASSAEASTKSPLRSMTISFVAPAEAGELHSTASLLRAGRSAVQLEARAIQGEQVVTAALASFGKPRESAIAVTPASAPEFPAPETCEALPYIEGLVPEFTQHFDYRIAAGAMPYSGSSEPRLGGWIRFKESAGPATTGHLLALIDAWPPAVLSMLKDFAPASSLTWTLELMPTAFQSQSDTGDWWQYLAEVEQAEDGYAAIQARLWNAEGKLVALSRQTAAVFG